MQEHEIVIAGIIVVAIFVIYGMYLGNRIRYQWSATVVHTNGEMVLVTVPSNVHMVRNSLYRTMQSGSGHITDASSKKIKLQNTITPGPTFTKAGVATNTVYLSIGNSPRKLNVGDVIKVRSVISPLIWRT